jgi:hypothetical protein
VRARRIFRPAPPLTDLFAMPAASANGCTGVVPYLLGSPGR